MTSRLGVTDLHILHPEREFECVDLTFRFACSSPSMVFVGCRIHQKVKVPKYLVCSRKFSDGWCSADDLS